MHRVRTEKRQKNNKKNAIGNNVKQNFVSKKATASHFNLLRAIFIFASFPPSYGDGAVSATVSTFVPVYCTV